MTITEIIQAVLSFFQRPPISDGDLSSRLDAIAAARGEKLDWRNSTVDLLKLLNLDSSLAARNDLARGFGVNDFKGTAEQNIWLHAKVMKEISERAISLPDKDGKP